MLSVRRLLKLVWFAAFAATALVALAACGGGGKSENSTDATSAAGSSVNVTLKEWSLTPDKSSVPAGSVTFTATNAGSFEHEMVVLKTDLAPDQLKLSGNTVDEEGSGQVIDEIPEFQPGATKDITLNLEPGNYVLFCNVSSHYQNGVRAAFTVAPAASGGSGSGY